MLLYIYLRGEPGKNFLQKTATNGKKWVLIW